MFANATFIFFLLCIAIQLWFVLYFFKNVFSKPRNNIDYTPIQPVSVIICGKNEGTNLRANLPAILAQRYTNSAGNKLFEVIVVDDGSDDDTQSVLERLAREYDNLVIITIDKNAPKIYPGKKNALNKAVAAAKNDILLMTDADCRPSSAYWLHYMVRPFHRGTGKEIVAGYGQYETAGGLLNSFVRWETVHTFLQLSTYARSGMPYMAVGRNMACTKEVFLSAQSTAEWSKLPSGDDDLLVRAAGGKNNVSVVYMPEAFTVSAAKDSWSSWALQKQRHMSTGKYYRFLIQVLLAKYGFSHAFMWLSFVVLLFTPLWGEALCVMLLRSVIYWSVWQRMACRLGEKKLIRYFPLFDIGWMIYNFAFSPYIIWKNKQQWR